MRLRVLDDVRPGYAQLAFDGPLSQSQLAISVRSETKAGFLGPNGKWQRTPHFFTAARIGGDDRSALYRVGPEIVNFLLLQDIVEFTAGDGSFRLETTWENATPAIPSAGRQKGQMYREGQPPARSAPTPVVGTPQREAAKPEETGPDEADAQEVEAREVEARESETQESESQPTETTLRPAAVTQPEAAAHLPPVSQLEMPPLADEPPDGDADAIGQEAQEPPPEKPGFFARYRGLLLALFSLVALAALGFGFYHFMPCGGWLGKECPGEREAAQTARACIAERNDIGRECDIAKECVAPYLVSFPEGTSALDLKGQAKTADDFCRQMEDRARGVFQCIADLKAQQRSRCDVQAACVEGFQAIYKRGPKRAEVDRAAQEAEDDCQGEQGEDQALRAARQCKADPQRKCTLPGCYVPYMDKYGTTGKYKDEAKREAVELDQACIAEEAENTTLASARECAKPTNPQRCAAPGCYTAYIKEFGESGRYRFDAQREATTLARECGDKERERQQEQERERAEQEEERLWGVAKSCAANASACDVKSCYATYDRTYAKRGKHIGEMQQDIARAEKICSQPQQQPAPAVQDGKYWARTDAACGARPTSVLVEVHGKEISWEHDFQGSLYRWSGTIDSGGNVTASNPNGHSATGQFTEGGTKVITMHYPRCTVTFTIHGKVG